MNYYPLTCTDKPNNFLLTLGNLHYFKFHIF